MKQKIAVLVALGVSVLCGQVVQPGGAEKSVTKVITLKYPNNINFQVLGGMGVTFMSSGGSEVLTGPQERVDTAEAILKQLDVPPPPRNPVVAQKNIQLTAYLIIASPAGTQGMALPRDLESPVNQVASVFPYKSFNLFDSIVMRLSNFAGGTLSGVLPQGQQTFPAGGTYRLSLSEISMTDAMPANLVRLTKFGLNVNILRGVTNKDGYDQGQNVSLETNIDMKEGQKIVVGKANIDGGENALIVILTAKAVD